MSIILTPKEIKETYLKLIETPSLINRLDQYTKDEVLKFANKELEKITRIAIDFLNAKNYKYPDKYKNNKLEYWRTRNPDYKKIMFVIDLLTKEPEQNISFKINFSDFQLKLLYSKLIDTYIVTNYETFEEVFTGNKRTSDIKIIWRPEGKNRQPNKKALLDLFYIVYEKFNIDIKDKLLFEYISNNFCNQKGVDIIPSYANKSNPPIRPFSEDYPYFESIIELIT